jgi:putative lipoprotein
MKYRIIALLLLGLSACGGKGPDTALPGAAPSGSANSQEEVMAIIEGNVVYRERMMLRPGAELSVQLEDVSRADAMATVITSQAQTLAGAPPYPFKLQYDPAQIDSRMRYGLRVKITQGDRLLFTNTDYIDPFSGNLGEVLVTAVPRSSDGGGPALEGPRWVLSTMLDVEVVTGAGGKAVDIQFDAAEQRYSGFSGCNRYTGGYEREGKLARGSALQLGPAAGTMMACVDGMELEQHFLKMLAKVDAFALKDGELVLLSGSTQLATFSTSER